MDTNTPCKYDWDDLEVGRFDVNHSEKFFRLYSNDTKDDTSGKENEFNNLNCYEFKKINKIVKDENFEKNNQQREINVQEKVQEEIKHILIEQQQEQQQQKQQQQQQQEQQQQQQQQQHENNKCQRRLIDFSKESRSQQPNNIKKSHYKFQAPKAYQYTEIYEKRRQKLINAAQEQSKKNLFYNRPASKFNYNGKVIIKSPTDDKMTVPITPFVLKKCNNFEKKRKQVEEVEKTTKIKQMTTLQYEAYKSKKQEIKPFNLNIEKRLEKRKLFDEKTKKQLEDKKKQEEEKKAREEKELIKGIRKLMTFKARPNPFKHN